MAEVTSSAQVSPGKPKSAAAAPASPQPQSQPDFIPFRPEGRGDDNHLWIGTMGAIWIKKGAYTDPQECPQDFYTDEHGHRCWGGPKGTKWSRIGWCNDVGNWPQGLLWWLQMNNTRYNRQPTSLSQSGQPKTQKRSRSSSPKPVPTTPERTSSRSPKPVFGLPQLKA